MAIYVLSVKHQTKGRGASALAHANYVARQGKYAERGFREEAGPSGSHAEYLGREGKHEKRAHELEYIGHGNMPEWAQENPMKFWDAADTYERANGRVYTEILVALPRELSRHERQELVRDFVGDELGDKYVYTVAIHNPRAMDGGEQPHAHIMFSNRELDGIERDREQFFKRANPEHPEKGGAKKSREWSKDDRANNKIEELRAAWERKANRALEKSGHEARIDRRSLKEQGIDREPEPKMGPEVTQRLKRGQETEKGERVLEIRNYRKQEKEMEGLEQELGREKAKVYDFAEEKRARGDEFRFGGERRQVPEEEKQKYRRTVDMVLTRYEREDGSTEYRWKKSGKVAFVDKGDRISFSSITPTAVKAGLQVAQEKGWDKVHATGSEEFRRESWTQGQLMGIEVKGYEATKEDREKVEALKKEQAQKKEQYRKPEERGPDSQGTREGPEGKKAPRETPFAERDQNRTKDPSAKKERPEGKEQSGPGDAQTAKASEVAKDVDAKIKATRVEIGKAEFEQAGGPSAEPHLREKKLRQDLDSLYRDKHDLKQLGDKEIKVNRSKDGSLEVADRKELKKQVQDLQKEQTKTKDKDRGPER